MKKLVADGYQDADALQHRIKAVEAWLAAPKLLRADRNAEYADILEIDLDAITEPILACPNDPDDVRPLSEVGGIAVQDVFLGSCMTNIGHFRAAAEIWRGEKCNPQVRTWICPPTRMDQNKLKEEGLFMVFGTIGARIEIAGCSLCMGNQARVPDNVTVYSTSTRNFDNRMGTGARVFLGSAELGAVTAILGRLPSPGEYFEYFSKRVAPKSADIYKSLQLDEQPEYQGNSGR